MKFPRRILVPVDFSPPSYAALQYAVRLFQRVGSALLIVHVVQHRRLVRLSPRGPQSIVLMKHESAFEKRHVADRLRQLLSSLGMPKSLRVRVLVESGDPAKVICGLAQQAGSDVILMGKTGANDAPNMGHLTEKLTQEAPCPVIPVWEELQPGENSIAPTTLP